MGMRRQRFGVFTGGLDLPDEKAATLTTTIASLRTPRQLRVPLDPCRLGGVEPRVDAPQRVAAGDLLAIAGGDTPVFAPLAGTVDRIGSCVLVDPYAPDAPRGTTWVSPAAEMTELAEPAELEDIEPVFDWEAASPEQLRQRIAEGGLTTCADPLTPLARWCVSRVAAGVDTVIANGLENQPYLTGEHRLLVSRGAEVVKGLAIIHKALGTAAAALAVDVRRTDRYRKIGVWAEALGVQSLAVEHKYPMGHPKMLTAVLTGRVPRPTQSPADVGVAIVNVAACFAAYRWVACGRRPTHRVVTVSGPHIRRPGNFYTPIGTPAEYLLLAAESEPGRAVLCYGGPMTGAALPDEAVVSPATAAVLSLPASDPRPATACIRCGWCTDHCPVRLDVANLNDMFELNQLHRARRYDVAACLGCGVCSYVCPARLPLTHRVQTLKRIAAQLE